MHGGSWRWLFAAGALLGISFTIKPLAVATVIPLGLAVLLRGRRERNLIVLAGLVVAVVAAISLLAGLGGVLDQIVDYRARARERYDWQFKENWAILSAALGRDQLAIYGLACIGAIGLAFRSPRAALVLAAWGLGSFLLLVFYTPLFPKHAATVMPPVAALAGAGLVCLWRAASRTGSDATPGQEAATCFNRLLAGSPIARLAARTAVIAGAGWLLAALPAMLTWDARLMQLGVPPPTMFADHRDAVQSIEALTPPGAMVLTDHPFLPFIAERLIPPPLSDPSGVSVRTRELTGAQIIAAAESYPSDVAVLWSSRFYGLRGFRAWFDERYQLAKIYGRSGDAPRALYVRRDLDLEHAREVLTADYPHRPGAVFAGGPRLDAVNLEPAQIRLGELAGLSLAWVATRSLEAEYHVVVKVVGPDGQTWDHEELSLSPRGDSLGKWVAGRWLIQVFTILVPTTAPSGDYTLIAELQDPKRGPVTMSEGPAPGLTELSLATLRVQ
jgi:hypothetical protein